MPGAIFEPYDVVVVPFPFTDKPVVKRRPALVLSTQAFSKRHDQLTLAMITTAAQADWPSDIVLRDWRTAGLATACRLRFKLFTLERRLVLRRVGALAQIDRRAVSRALPGIIALS